jgi:hypothetical protein
MTVKLLGSWGAQPAGTLFTSDAATEAAMITAKVATADLTGGVVYAPPGGKTIGDLIARYPDSTGAALVDPQGRLIAFNTPSTSAGPRGMSAAALMADADRMLSTRGRPLTRWTNPVVTNGGVQATLAEAGMFDTSLSYCAKLVGTSGSRPTVTSPIIGTAAASTNFFGVLIQCKMPFRSGRQHIPLRVRLSLDGTAGNTALGSFSCPADGVEHWIVLGAQNFSVNGTFVIGTSTITHVYVEDRNDIANLGWDGLQPGEVGYIGQVYLNPKGRAKAIIRFDDSLQDLDTAAATFTGDGVSQAWSCASLLKRYGYRGSTFNLSKRIGVNNAGASFVTWARLQALYAEGWDHCVQAHADPADALNSGARLLGPLGFALRAVASVDASANTVTSAATHGISNGGYWGYPITFSGTDLPAPLVAGVEYWTRYSSTTAFTLHPTELDSIANSNVIDITTTGTAANFFWRYSGSANDGSAIAADYARCRGLLIANGMPRGANIIALNQGAYDRSVVEALDGYDLVLGILGGSGATASLGRSALGEGAASGIAGFIGGTFLSMASAIQTDGAPNAATIRAYVQAQCAAGVIFSNYHHNLTAGNGVQLDAYLDELRIQNAAGAVDICTVSEVAEYLKLFRPLHMPYNASPV